jgi:aldose sugar dehydrogenase
MLRAAAPLSLLAAAVLAVPSVRAAPSSHPPEYVVQSVVSGLHFPWSLAFLPGGDMLVSEKYGGVRRVHDGRLEPAPLAGGPQHILQHGDSGLLDIALDPDFEHSHRLYISFNEGTVDANHVAIYRAQLQGGALVDGRVIFRQQPDKKGDSHSGGRMAFLPDDTLLLTVSDGYDYKEEAQNLATDFGSVVRITRDGEVPADNPFVGRSDARPEIYTYGHRNALGLLRDPRDGSIWLHENGPKGGDEINHLKAGANYGWPKTCFGIDYSGEQITKLQRADGIEDPVVVWVPSIAPSGFALYLGDRFPQWRGDFFVGALAEKSIRRVRIEGGAWTEQQILLRELDTRIRDVRAGPDGYLYVLTDADPGALLRLTPPRTQS